MSDATISTTLHELHEADGAPFSELVAIAGLKPSEDFRDADLRGIDFAESDLTGYDFSGADLSGASFVGARIDRARFGNANLSDTVWPAGWHSSSEHPGAPRTVLSPLQTEIVNRLTQDLRQTAPGRAIASLPNGIGQTSIMSAVLSDLQASYELRSVLVLTETIAERERIVSGLRHMGFRVSPDRSGFSENAAPEPGEFRVETFSNVHRHLQLLERRHDPHGLDLGFSHIVLTSLPNRRSVDIAALANQPTPPAMLAFSQPFSVTFDAEGRLVGDEIREVFPIRAVVCSFEDALSGGLLEPVEIMIRDGLLNDDAPMTSAGVGDTMSRLDQVVYDFVQELTEIPFEVPAVLIAPTIDSVDRLVNILDETVHFAPAGNSRRRPVAISSRHKREAARFRRDGEGLIAVMTPQMLDGFDIGDTGLIGILAKLPKRHMAKLAFAPASRPRRLVIDYSSETPFTNWASLVRPVDELSKPNFVPM